MAFMIMAHHHILSALQRDQHEWSRSSVTISMLLLCLYIWREDDVYSSMEKGGDALYERSIIIWWASSHEGDDDVPDDENRTYPFAKHCDLMIGANSENEAVICISTSTVLVESADTGKVTLCAPKPNIVPEFASSTSMKRLPHDLFYMGAEGGKK